MVTETAQLELLTVYDNPCGGLEPRPASYQLLGQTFEQTREHFDRQGTTGCRATTGDDPVIFGTFRR